MGMPCEVNSLLKLNRLQGLPIVFLPESFHQALKKGYRIIPVNVPIPLVDESWTVRAEIIIHKLVWENDETALTFEIIKVYETASPANGNDLVRTQ
jgi:hypothetical protein